MSLTKNRWFRRFGIGAIAALSLSTAAMAASPAQYRDYGYRPRVEAHHAAFLPRFFGFGGYDWHHWDHRWR